jgi:RimJ/RimL family protein N-acetyltransferase
MSSRHSVDSVDLRQGNVDQVFSRLSGAILAEQADPATAEQQLWRLPEAVTRFVCNPVTEADWREVSPIVHRLRMSAASLIDERLDRSSAKTALAHCIGEARQEIRFRSWQEEDTATLRSLLDDEKVWAGLPDPYPGAVDEDMASQLITIANGWSARHWVQAVEWQGQPIGQVRLQFDSSPFLDSAEISYWLGHPFWGRGLATRIVTLFTAECFNRWPQVQHIFANVLDHNQASLRVLAKAHYHHESFHYKNVTKEGATRSTVVVGVCRGDYDVPAPVVEASIASRIICVAMGIVMPALDGATQLAELSLAVA